MERSDIEEFTKDMGVILSRRIREMGADNKLTFALMVLSKKENGGAESVTMSPIQNPQLLGKIYIEEGLHLIGKIEADNVFDTELAS